MRRRHVLGCCAGLAAGLFTSLPARAQGYAFGEGFANPCRGALPADLAAHELVQRAFEGPAPAALWDTHAHLLGTGDSGSGCTVHPSLDQWWRPVEYVRKRAILNAACVPGDAPSIDRAYVQRLLDMAADFPAGAAWMLFAFDRAHDDDGRPREDWTTFHVPDAYAAAVARTHAQRFRWVASVHPYRDDALAALDAALAAGALAVKWLPSAMNIDPRDPRCVPFYERLRARGVPLVVHFGEEKAVPGAHREAFGNPLLARVPLSHGVRVIAAHAGSLGFALDTDRPSAPRVPSFELFARVMDEPAWRGLLLADISALFQANRTADVWRTVLRRADWHERLMHGSDHPLPGVMPLYAPARLAAEGLLDARAVAPLRRLREHNALLFDFVLKRHLRDGSARLADAVFDTRRHFARGTATVAAGSREGENRT